MKLDTHQKYALLVLMHKYHENYEKEPHDTTEISNYIERIISMEIDRRIANYKIPASLLTALKEDLQKKIH